MKTSHKIPLITHLSLRSDYFYSYFWIRWSVKTHPTKWSNLQICIDVLINAISYSTTSMSRRGSCQDGTIHLLHTPASAIHLQEAWWYSSFIIQRWRQIRQHPRTVWNKSIQAWLEHKMNVQQNDDLEAPGACGPLANSWIRKLYPEEGEITLRLE